ncbi:MAG TPA: methyltransferase domain-containing protein [Patescibacteria group bacterium]|nr:methyltransferase domain-containing protein [Patescibacteria group bacterium]
MIAAEEKLGRPVAEKFYRSNGDTYDRVAGLSTVGLDSWWKHLILKHMPPHPRRVLDQACGTGILTLKIASRYPRCQVTGVDMQEDYVAIARLKAKAMGLTNVEFIHGRPEDVILTSNSVDCITSSYLAKYADLDRLVGQAARMLRPGRGTLIVHELTYPSHGILRFLWRLHMKFLQTYSSARYPEWEETIRELPPVLQETQWLAILVDALRNYQFYDIQSKRLTLDATALVVARKPDDSSDEVTVSIDSEIKTRGQYRRRHDRP